MQTIELRKGSCADQEVDVVVNAANRHLAEGTGICGAIFKKAGSREMTAACRKYSLPLKDGEAVITPAFGISNAKAVIHAVGPNFNYNPGAFNLLFDAYYNSMLVMKENGYHSISFPLISSGVFAGNMPDPVGESTSQCCSAYDKFIKDYPDYDINVYLCAFSSKEYDIAKKHPFFSPEERLPVFWDADGAGVVSVSELKTYRVPSKTIQSPIDKSLQKEWIIPCNLDYYDLPNALKKLKIIDWSQPRQMKNAHVGDMVYIYLSKKPGEIRYKGAILAVGKTENIIDDSTFSKGGSGTEIPCFTIAVFREYTLEGKLKYSNLKETGLKSVLQGPTIAKGSLAEYLHKCDELQHELDKNGGKIPDVCLPLSDFPIEINEIKSTGEVTIEIDINTALKPKKSEQTEKGVMITCPKCGYVFSMAPRCPECGQLIQYKKERWNKPKLGSLEAWESSVNIIGADPKDVADIVREIVKDDSFSYHIGSKDLNLHLYAEGIDASVKIFMFFGKERCGAFQPSALINYINENGLKKSAADWYMEAMKPLLSDSQKNIPYNNLKGYYFVDYDTLFARKDELIQIFQGLKKELSE